MSLGRAGEDYLEAILLLRRRKGSVRAVAIAEELGVSRASVCVALKGLREKGCIIVDEDNEIYLTALGQKIAESVNERRQLFLALFVQLGINQEPAAWSMQSVERALRH